MGNLLDALLDLERAAAVARLTASYRTPEEAIAPLLAKRLRNLIAAIEQEVSLLDFAWCSLEVRLAKETLALLPEEEKHAEEESLDFSVPGGSGDAESDPEAGPDGTCGSGQ